MLQRSNSLKSFLTFLVRFCVKTKMNNNKDVIIMDSVSLHGMTSGDMRLLRYARNDK